MWLAAGVIVRGREPTVSPCLIDISFDSNLVTTIMS